MVWIYRRTNTIMFILHCSRYSAWFKRHKSSVPPPELRQKLSPFCVLVLWLKPTFKQCRNTVEMKVWFNHLACHWKLMLARRGFTPFAFPWFHHLYIQLGSVCKDAGWVVCGAPGHTQPVQSMNPVPGSLAPLPDSLTDTDRAWGEHGGPRNRHQCQKAKVNLWRWGSSEPAWSTELQKKLA